MSPTDRSVRVLADIRISSLEGASERSLDDFRKCGWTWIDRRTFATDPEPDDAASTQRARALAVKHDAVTQCVNTSAPGSKAGAITHAIETAVDPSGDGSESVTAIGVFDADERVDPAFVDRALAAVVAGMADVVQGRTVPEPTGLIESIAYYQSVLLSYAGRRLLNLHTDFRMAASRSVVFSLAPIGVAVALALRTVDAWRGHVDGVGWSWLLLPLIFPIYSLAAIKAVIETSWPGTAMVPRRDGDAVGGR